MSDITKERKRRKQRQNERGGEGTVKRNGEEEVRRGRKVRYSSFLPPFSRLLICFFFLLFFRSPLNQTILRFHRLTRTIC